MIRVSTLIWTLLVILSGFSMFQVKSEVGRLDRHLAGIHHRIASDREQMHELDVEWAMLTQPQRLEMLGDHVLQLTTISTAVLGSFDAVPLRDDVTPPPAPPMAKPTTPGAPTAQLAEIAVRTRP
jgi:hypothetical protein